MMSGETRECSDQVRALPAELLSSQPEYGLCTAWVTLALWNQRWNQKVFLHFFFASFDCGSWVKDCNAVLHPCQSMSQPGYPQLTEIYLHMALLQPFDRKLCLECSEKEKHFVKRENFGWKLKTESGSATSKGSLMRYESYERTKVQFWVHDEIRPDFQLEAKVQTFPISCHLLACLDLIFWPGTPLNLWSGYPLVN